MLDGPTRDSPLSDRRLRGALWIALPAGATVFSTVYLSLPYVIDVVAGGALAAVMISALDPLRRASDASEAGASTRDPRPGE